MNSDVTTLITRGYEARKEHRSGDARSAFSEAIERSRASEDESSLARALTGLGQIERDDRNLDLARRHYEEVAAIQLTQTDTLRFAGTLRHLADLLLELGELKRAGACYRQALSIYRANPNAPRLDLANAISGYARFQEKGGADASQLWGEAKALYDAEGVQAGVEESDAAIARLPAFTRDAERTSGSRAAS